MFVGHYGASFAVKSIDHRIPLWVLFIFGPPLPSDRAAAVTALASYAVFAGVIAWWERSR